MRLYNTASPSIKLQIRPPRGLAQATLIPILARRACRWPFEFSLIFMNALTHLSELKTNPAAIGRDPPLDPLSCVAPCYQGVSVRRDTHISSSGVSSSRPHASRNCELPYMTTGLPLVVAGNKPGPPNTAFVDGSNSGLDMDFLATISDLEAWSSSLIL